MNKVSPNREARITLIWLLLIAPVSMWSFRLGKQRKMPFCAQSHTGSRLSSSGSEEMGLLLCQWSPRGRSILRAAKGCIWVSSICIHLLSDSLATAGERKSSGQYPAAPPHTAAYLLALASGLGVSTNRSCLYSLFLGPKESFVLGSTGGQGQGKREPASNSRTRTQARMHAVTPSASIRR